MTDRGTGSSFSRQSSICNGSMRGMAKRKNPAAVALGKRGGKKGGPARARKLTPERRSEIARKAVQTRWAKHKETT